MLWLKAVEYTRTFHSMSPIATDTIELKQPAQKRVTQIVHAETVPGEGISGKSSLTSRFQC
jgi:hypothetical protein